jgi:hypothetical protein
LLHYLKQIHLTNVKGKIGYGGVSGNCLYNFFVKLKLF